MLQGIFLLRILLAGVCGIIVGLERKRRSKEAGIRTHFIVACGAGLYVVGIGVTLMILVVQLILHIDVHRRRKIKDQQKLTEKQS